MKAIQYIAIACIMTAGSGTGLLAQKSVYTLPFENETRLPPMHVYINMEEISKSYQTTGLVFTNEFNGPGDESMEQISTSYINDEKVVDAIRFLKYYLDDQLLTPGEEKSGTIEMNVIYFNEKTGFSAGSLLGIFTLGLGTLCGIPYARTVSDLELEAILFDANDKFVAKYRGVGRAAKSLSVYSSASARKAHQKALKEAIEDLNVQIMGDLR